MDDLGNPVDREVTSYFQIIKLVTDKSRPHLMPTVQTALDTVARERLALSTQEASGKVDGRADDTVLVYLDSDPEWRGWKACDDAV